jgi:hypothetical protein
MSSLPLCSLRPQNGHAIGTDPSTFRSQLCHSHIIATSQRTPASRLVAVLGSDLRDFIASGMLTLKARVETVDEGKIIPRASEVWWFFWTQVLPVSQCWTLSTCRSERIDT